MMGSTANGAVVWREDWVIAQPSDKWHHSMMRYLGFPQDTFFMFGIAPGVCREAIGRPDLLYTKPDAFDSKLFYSWSRFHHEKITKSRFSTVRSYYGTCPFVWELGRVHTQRRVDPKGSLFFLPRDDQVTIRVDEHQTVQDAIDSAPTPVTFLVPFRDCDKWRHWTKLKLPEDHELVSLTDRDARQIKLATLFQKHDHVYIPWPGTDLYYAAYLGKAVHLYDDIRNYRTKTRDEMDREPERILSHLKWGYDYLTEKQKTFFHWTENWNDIDFHDRVWLVNNMLGLDALKSPRKLYTDMIENGMIHPLQQFREHESYQRGYEWIVKQQVDSDLTTLGAKMAGLL